MKQSLSPKDLDHAYSSLLESVEYELNPLEKLLSKFFRLKVVELFLTLAGVTLFRPLPSLLSAASGVLSLLINIFLSPILQLQISNEVVVVSFLLGYIVGLILDIIARFSRDSLHL
jgi:hypothetical protein